MKIVLAFTKRRIEVIKALETAGWDYEAVDVSRSEEAYWELLNELWEAQRSFIVVEHDVVVLPNTITQLVLCPESWCSFPVEYFNGPYAGLGCAKFSETFIREHPTALAHIAGMSDDAHPPKSWCRLDGWLQQILGKEGARRHVHSGVLKHLRDDTRTPYPSHGCVRRPD